MADDLLNTNGNAEVDPAADFLAREQDELAELGEDFQTEDNGGVSSWNLERLGVVWLEIVWCPLESILAAKLTIE